MPNGPYQPPEPSKEELERVEADRQRVMGLGYILGGYPMSPGHRAALEQSNSGQSRYPQGDGPYPPAQIPRSQLTNELLIEAKIRLCSPRNKQWLEETAKLDSGANDNWISPSVAAQLNAEIVTGPRVIYTTFTGERVESTEVVNLVTWTTVGIETSFKTDFRLAGPNSPFDVLLGKETVEEIYQHREALVLVKIPETQEQKEARKATEKKVETEAKDLEARRKSAATSSNAGSSTSLRGAMPTTDNQKGGSR